MILVNRFAFGQNSMSNHPDMYLGYSGAEDEVATRPAFSFAVWS